MPQLRERDSGRKKEETMELAVLCVNPNDTGKVRASKIGTRQKMKRALSLSLST